MSKDLFDNLLREIDRRIAHALREFRPSLRKTTGAIPSNQLPAAGNTGTGYTPAAHNHGAADIVSGTLDTARLGSGTADNTTFLRGDQTWAALEAAPSAHASTHQHGGADEVATATPAANAIPKAGAGGQLAGGWLPAVVPIVSYGELNEAAAPATPAAAQVRLYAKADGWLYSKDDSGVEAEASAPSVRCRVYNSAAINVATGTTHTTVTFNSETFDTDGMHSTVSNTSRVTAQRDGMYAISGYIRWQAAAGGRRQLRLLLNGGTVIALHEETGAAEAGITPFQAIHAFYPLSATDYVELQVLQTSGATITIDTTSGNGTPVLQVIRMGPL